LICREISIKYDGFGIRYIARRSREKTGVGFILCR
jgi:hypothetical protein